MHSRNKLFTKLKHEVEESSLSHLMSGAWIQEDLPRLQDNAWGRCRVCDPVVVIILIRYDLFHDKGTSIQRYGEELLCKVKYLR